MIASRVVEIAAICDHKYKRLLLLLEVFLKRYSFELAVEDNKLREDLLLGSFLYYVGELGFVFG